MPANTTPRARGWTRGGYCAGSEWFAESVARPALPIRLSISRSGAHVLLGWTGGQGPYQVQQCTDLSDLAGWTDLGEPLSTNSITLPIGRDNLFVRVKGQ